MGSGAHCETLIYSVTRAGWLFLMAWRCLSTGREGRIWCAHGQVREGLLEGENQVKINEKGRRRHCTWRGPPARVDIGPIDLLQIAWGDCLEMAAAMMPRDGGSSSPTGIKTLLCGGRRRTDRHHTMSALTRVSVDNHRPCVRRAMGRVCQCQGERTARRLRFAISPRLWPPRLLQCAARWRGSAPSRTGRSYRAPYPIRHAELKDASEENAQNPVVDLCPSCVVESVTCSTRKRQRQLLRQEVGSGSLTPAAEITVDPDLFSTATKQRPWLGQDWSQGRALQAGSPMPHIRIPAAGIHGGCAPRYAASPPRTANATSAVATQLMMRSVGLSRKDVARRGTAAPRQKLPPPCAAEDGGGGGEAWRRITGCPAFLCPT